MCSMLNPVWMNRMWWSVLVYWSIGLSEGCTVASLKVLSWPVGGYHLGLSEGTFVASVRVPPWPLFRFHRGLSEGPLKV
jgi:hypothetical protein